MKALAGMKIAVLVANGFDEKTFLTAQKTVQELGATMKIISTNQGLVNGWNGTNWGHNYAVDASLNTALGVDYDAIIIPGGTRSMDKLKMTAHTRRFISSFMAAKKPVIAFADSMMLMAHADQIQGRTVSGMEETRNMAEQAGATWSQDDVCMDGNLLSGANSEMVAQEMVDMLNNAGDMQQAA